MCKSERKKNISEALIGRFLRHLIKISHSSIRKEKVRKGLIRKKVVPKERNY